MSRRRSSGAEATQQARPDVVASIAEPSAPGSHHIEFDNDAIEGVLQRAVELGVGSDTAGRSLDPETLVEIAAEVGIPPAAVAAALAEQRLGIDREVSLLDRLIGPDEIWSERASGESAQRTIERASVWLERGHGLRPRTTSDGVVIARRRDGVAGRVHRSLRSVQGRGELGRLREVRAVAVDLESDVGADPIGAVVILADLSDKRTGAVAGGAAVITVGGALVLTTAAVAGTPLVLAALPAVAGAGLATSRWSFRSTLRRAQFAVDETIDHVANGREAPSLLADLTAPLTEKLRRKR